MKPETDMNHFFFKVNLLLIVIDSAVAMKDIPSIWGNST